MKSPPITKIIIKRFRSFPTATLVFDNPPVLLRRLLAEANCQNIGVGRPIRRTQSQPAMSAIFNMGLAHRRNRSFRKLVKAIGDLLTQLQQPLPAWPPAQWQAD
jgi:hypothetical protein